MHFRPLRTQNNSKNPGKRALVLHFITSKTNSSFCSSLRIAKFLIFSFTPYSLSHTSDQINFLSRPNDVCALSKGKVKRTYNMIAQGKMFSPFIKFSRLIWINLWIRARLVPSRFSVCAVIDGKD